MALRFDASFRNGSFSEMSAGHIALVGSTGTGKTRLAIRLAQKFADVELISIDAMAVYIGFDIGAAKPLGADRTDHVWHLLDLVLPEQEFSVAEFQKAFKEVILDIESREKRAILVGGTGLYHRAAIDDLQLPSRYPNIVSGLEETWSKAGGPEELYALLCSLDAAAAEKILPGNKRRIIRALEVTMGAGRPFSSFGPGLEAYEQNNNIELFGLYAERKELYQRLERRLDDQLEAGFIDEVKELRKNRLISKTALQAIGYKELLEYLNGEISLLEAKEKILSRTRLYAKRQESWFRRDPRVRWLKGSEEENFQTVYTYMESYKKVQHDGR
jgi:tRNA dimethylallyltransferase